MGTRNGVTIITCTGERQESLNLCAQWIARQTWPSIQWIVVDDGREPSYIPDILPDTTKLRWIRPTPFWTPGENTLARNILAALPYVEYDTIFFFEDDDYYPADYIERMMDNFNPDHWMIGEIPARYYHVPTNQYRILDNASHASLCQTAIRTQLVPDLQRICEEPNTQFIDVRLWRSVPGMRAQRLSSVDFTMRRSAVVGIKGMPGRPGIGIGHQPTNADWEPDPDHQILRAWLGSDVSVYADRAATLSLSDPPQASLTLPRAEKTAIRIPQPSPQPSQNDFEEFYWKKQKRYKCNQVWESGAPCEFDTYDLEAMLVHIRGPHNLAGKVTPKKVRVSPILDAAGKSQIVNAEPPPAEFKDIHFKKD